MSEFRQHYWGHFAACLRWEQAQAVAERIAATAETWYRLHPEQTPLSVIEEGAADAAGQLRDHVAEMQRLKRGNYCNLVFVDDFEAPALIKAFHPRRAGDACRVGGDPIPPWLVLSRLPVDTGVFEPEAGEESAPPSWLSRLFHRSERL
jgi:hypothetical protein